MSIELDNLKKFLDEWIESDEAKVYFEKEGMKNKIKESRFKRFEEWLKHNDFDKLIYRLILEHGDEWREKCWHNGFEAYPNNKLEFIIDYIIHNLESISVENLCKNFPNDIWFFKGYYFQITYGQGSVIDIYNKDDFRHLLQI